MQLPIERVIVYERLSTPADHLSVLIEPDAARLSGYLAADRSSALGNADVLDSSVAELRERLRADLGLKPPVILCGHQAEFFHAGVFAKSIAADTLARLTGGQTIYLTVDSDTPKTGRLVTPVVERGAARRQLLAIPGFEQTLPMEFQPRLESGRWRAFFDAARGLLPEAEATLLPTFIAGWFRDSPRRIQPCDAFVTANVAVEDSLGLRHARQARSSELSATLAFRAFVAHLALHAARFRAAYNEAQRAYRLRRRVRSPQRPVPELRSERGRIELPFWVVRPDMPRRRLYVQSSAGCTSFFADREQIGRYERERLSRAAAHEQPWPFEAAGWQLRPRALTLSAFCRLFVCDLFIHGIGGAKYDELTEAFVRGFYGIEPAPRACVTATAHLELPRHDVMPAALRRARHAARDVRYNPQRRLHDLPLDRLRERERLVRESQRLRREARADRAARREIHQAIHRTNDLLCEHDPRQFAALNHRLETIERQWRENRVALDREYFYAFHTPATVGQLVQRIRAALSVEKV